MANGQPLDDTALTAAMWAVPFGTRVLVRRGDRAVVVRITDRGPARRLVKAGRIIDLSRAAFAALAPLDRGLIQVDIEILPGGRDAHPED